MSTTEALADLLSPTALGDPEDAKAAGPGWWADHPPSSVVRPGSVDEVVSVMEWAGAEDVGVLPCGSGAWTRPVIAERPFVALSAERLRGVEAYEAADLTLTAGAGTPFREVGDALGANGQWAPFDPPCVERRSLGGLVADGASGPLWTGYGELRNHVLGMTVVTGDGRTLRLGGRVVKNVAGFDLLKAMVGSRGSLGMITSICVRAFPEPAVDALLTARGASLEKLIPLALAVGTAPVLPVSVVVSDRVEELGSEAGLVVRLHGAATTVAADRATIEHHAGTAFDLVSEEVRDRLLAEVRDRGAEEPARLTVSVRPSCLPELVQALERLGTAAVTVDAYGGLVRIASASFDADAVDSLAERVAALGGATRIDAWPHEAQPPQWDVQSGSGSDSGSGVRALTRRLGEAFDPRGVLWPCRR